MPGVHNVKRSSGDFLEAYFHGVLYTEQYGESIIKVAVAVLDLRLSMKVPKQFSLRCCLSDPPKTMISHFYTSIS